jgi:hypothetical protein
MRVGNVIRSTSMLKATTSECINGDLSVILKNVKENISFRCNIRGLVRLNFFLFHYIVKLALKFRIKFRVKIIRYRVIIGSGFRVIIRVRI